MFAYIEQGIFYTGSTLYCREVPKQPVHVELINMLLLLLLINLTLYITFSSFFVHFINACCRFNIKYFRGVGRRRISVCMHAHFFAILK